MCDAEKDWHERSFRASEALEGPAKFSFFANPKSYFLSVISTAPVHTKEKRWIQREYEKKLFLPSTVKNAD